MIVTPDSDYPNFDYNTLKGVTLDGCKAACLADQKCRAFTFNQKAGWCFMKTDFGALAGVARRDRRPRRADGRADAERRAQAARPSSTSSPTVYLDEARALIGSLKRRFDPGDSSLPGAPRRRRRRPTAPATTTRPPTDFGKALVIANENPGLWLDFATASLPRKPETYDARVQAESDVTAAAINAYLRSEQPANRAAALALMGDGFANREIWKPAYRVLSGEPRDQAERRRSRRATTRSSPSTASASSPTTSTPTRPNPRICIVFSDTLAGRRVPTSPIS